MGVEGVLNGSKGAGYYPADEWAKAVPSWNHKPVMMYHPEKNGKPVSASDTDVIETSQLGFLLNTSWEDKLKTECWLEEDTLKATDKGTEVYNAVLEKKKVEVSTGLFMNEDPTTGQYNGTDYKFVAREHQPDHLAILPDRVGACSIEMGAGLCANELQALDRVAKAAFVINSKPSTAFDPTDMVTNELSLGQVEQIVRDALRVKFAKPGYDWNGYVYDVFDTYVVYAVYGSDYVRTLYKMDYSIDGGSVTFSGSPVQVVMVTQYQTVDGTIVGNGAGWSYTMNGDKTMAKPNEKPADVKPFVDRMIANSKGKFKEDDRAWITNSMSTMTVEQLEKMLEAYAPPAPEPTPTPAVTPPAVTTPAANQGQQTSTKKSYDEWMAEAPAEVRNQVNRLKKAEDNAKTQLIANIVGSGRCPFDEAYLKAQPLEVLQCLNFMAMPQEQQDVITNGGSVVNPNFAALITGIPVLNSNNNQQQAKEKVPEPLRRPTVNWTEKEKVA